MPISEMDKVLETEEMNNPSYQGRRRYVPFSFVCNLTSFKKS
jgi:hypothetical protein